MAGKAGRSGRKRATPAEKKKAGKALTKQDKAIVAVDWKAKLPPTLRAWSPVVVAEHERLGKLLVDGGVLTEGDWIAWQAGMSAYGQWLTYSKMYDDLDGDLVITNESGNRYADPVVNLLRQAWKDVLTFCSEFGLTPRARGAVVSFVVEEQSAMGAMLDEDEA